MKKWETIHPSDPGHGKPKPYEVEHVKNAQRWLRSNRFKEDFRPGPLDGIAGYAFWHAVERAKRALGYTTTSAQRPVFGQALYNYLSGAKPLPAGNKVRRRAYLRKIAKHDPIRQNMVAIGRWLIAHESEVHYSQRRPILLPKQYRNRTKQLVALKDVPVFFQQTDCSGSTTQAAWVAGVSDDINGNGWTGSGWTGSISAHCRQISLHELLPGDMVIFGIAPTHHVAFVLVPGTDPLLCSHGMERGPLAIKLSQEAAYHAGEGGYCFFSLLDR